ncbi:hypothetical protein IKP13_05410 [bacterium]|nr:hypothetical protein [bacterium]
MADCTECKFAKWDYEFFPDRGDKLFFVCGCKLGHVVKDDKKECEGFEEYDEGND